MSIYAVSKLGTSLTKLLVPKYLLFVSVQDGGILDENTIASLSLVDAVIHQGRNLKLRPSQTKVEPTSSQEVTHGSADEGRIGEQASKRGDLSGKVV